MVSHSLAHLEMIMGLLSSTLDQHRYIKITFQQLMLQYTNVNMVAYAPVGFTFLCYLSWLCKCFLVNIVKKWILHKLSYLF